MNDPTPDFILGWIADIPALQQAFKDGIDIHALTASEMFNVPLDQMTPDVRRKAKAINFGVIYGISEGEEMSTLGDDLIQAMTEALAHAKGEGPAVVHAPVIPREIRENVYRDNDLIPARDGPLDLNKWS